ncbi:natural cytotoxicity triggering receptor 3 ligand 1 [Erethizon dorsatum]
MPSLCGRAGLSAASRLRRNRHRWAHGRRVRSVPWGAVMRLALLCPALTTVGSLEVVVPRRPETVCLNDNVTISCKVPGFPRLDTNIVGVTWSRGTGNKVFELFGNNKIVTRTGAKVSPERLQWGDASLQLPGVQLGDAGEYWCRLVVTPQVAEGKVSLEVLAMPTSRVFLEQTMGKGKDTYLVCQSSGFYPEAINITWEKWTLNVPQYQRISKDIWTGPTIKNEDGTFNITSSLKICPSLEDMYSCVVWHTSLHTSQRWNFTLSVTEAEKIDHSWLLAFIPIGLISINIFLKYIWTRCYCCKPTPSSDTEEGTIAPKSVVVCTDDSNPSRVSTSTSVAAQLYSALQPTPLTLGSNTCLALVNTRK